jgi:hypothetical protein
MRHLRQFARSLRNAWRGPAPVCLKTCLYLPQARLIYAYVPKAACTSIKTWLLRYSGECPEIAAQFASAEQANVKPPAAHDMMRDHFSIKRWSEGAIRSALEDPACFKFTFVRHPLRRLVSGYLDKVVKTKAPAHEIIASGQRAQGIVKASAGSWWRKLQFDEQRSLTFREFVQTLHAFDPETIDVHFRAQHRLLRGLKFDFVGKIEELPGNFAVVQQHVRNAAQLAWRHTSDYAPTAGECVADWSAARFRGVSSPPWQSFFDEPLQAACCELYAMDFELFDYDPTSFTRLAA